MSILDGIYEQIFPNGLKLLCLRKPGAPVVAVQVWYRTGSAGEEPGRRGTAHILEHMMFRGSKNVAAEEHSRRISDVGGHANAMTAEDVTAYTNSVPVEHLRMVLELEAERMQNLTLDPGLFETERRVIMEEYRTYMDNPVAKAFLEFRQAFFGDHPYAVSSLGTAEDIARATPASCRACYESWYRPCNALLAVVGGVESEAQVAQIVGEVFGDIPPAAAPAARAVAVVPSGPKAIVRRVEFDVPMQMHGFAAPPAGHEDAAGLDVLMRIAGHGASSRLYHTIVRRRRAAVAAGGSNLLFRQAGMSLMFAVFTPDVRAGRIQRCMDDVVGGICRDGVTRKELDKVRNTELAQRTFEMYTAEQLCHRLGWAETVEGGYRRWVDRLAILHRLDTEQLRLIAQRYWDNSARWALTLLPRRTKVAVVVAGLFRRVLAWRPRQRCGAGGGAR